MKKNAREARLSLTKATSAVILGLALAATPTFAHAAQEPAAAQAASADGAQAQADENTFIVQNGGSSFTDAVNKGATTIELQGNGDDGKGMFNLWSYTDWFGNKHWSGTLGTDAETVNINHNLTIVNKTGNANAYLYGVTFVVQPGAKLTLVDVNIDDARMENATGPAVPAITVKAGGSLETKGEGDIATDNGRGEAWAVKLEGSDDASTKATAVLGAAPSGFMANVGEAGWTAENAGNYGGTYCVTAGLNSDLTITDGRFTSENAQHQAIQSYGSVKIKPASDQAVFSTNNEGESASQLGTVEIDGTLDGKATGAKLVAEDTAFGYIAPGGLAQVGEEQMKATVQLNGEAKAYLTNSNVEPIADGKLGELPSVWLDSSATLYEQEDESNPFPLSTSSLTSTGSDFPAFQNDFKSVYEGDHLTKNQYKVQVTLPADNNGIQEDVTNKGAARGLWKLADDAEFSDLETLVAASKSAEKLTEGAQEVASTDPGQSDSTVLSANLELGKSQVYAEYELAKNETTSISGTGHAYAFSQVHDLQAGWDVSAYRQNGTFTAPEAGTKNGNVDETVPEGYVFAGWYTTGGDLRNADITSVIPDFTSEVMTGDLFSSKNPAQPFGQDTTTGYAYAKFVPAGLFNVKGQNHVGENWSPQYPNAHARFVSALDSYNYDGVDYTITLTKADGTTSEQKVKATTAFDYIIQAGKKTYAYDADAYGDVAKTIGTGKQLLFTRAYIDGSLDGVTSVKVSVTVRTPDGTSVTVAPKTFPVEGGQLQSSQNNN